MSDVGQKRPLLVIDDDKKLCALIKEYLEPLGYAVEMRHTGTEGLEEAVEGEYEAVILDVMMPGMDGFEVLREMRKKTDVPVLMLTAMGEESDRIVGLEIGADDYLPKTFSTRELLARLRAVTRRAHLANPAPDQCAETYVVGDEAEALSQLINELLDFSRASIAPGTLPAHEVSVPLLLKEVAEREGQGAEVEITCKPELWITTNRDVLRRALANVVRNANRHAGEAGPIDLRAESKGETLVIQVLDHGPGIPEEWIERVFEPFSRPERARTREGGGAGLGLAIAKTCMEGLGGRIRARNRSEGGLAVELEVRPMVNGSKG